MTEPASVGRILGLYSGSNTDFSAEVASGIAAKRPAQSLNVFAERVAGDTQADPKHHGGPDRVLHHFPREHYAYYQAEGLIGDGRKAPAMGENISTLGLDEHRIHIGDIFTLGDVLLQVTQPRSPCFKLNLQFGHPEFAHRMQTSGRCGWFYRVLTPGVIHATDSMTLLERRTDISVFDAMGIYFLPQFDGQAYEKLASCEALAQSWRQSLERRIALGGIEDWQMRLYGKPAEE